jgi:hypothetical protein
MRNVIRSVAASASAQVHSVENSTFFPRAYQSLQLVHSSGSFSNTTISNASAGYSMSGHEEGYQTKTGSSSAANHTATVGASTTTPSGPTQRTSMEDVDGVDNERKDGPVNGGATFSSLSNATTSPPPAEMETGDISNNSHLRRFRSIAHKNASVGANIPQPQHKYTPNPRNSHSFSPSTFSGSSTGAAVGVRGSRTPQAHAIIICGPAGIGKSSLIQMQQANWRRQGLWGHAKMVKGEASPFTGLVSRVSGFSSLRTRNLIIFETPAAYLFILCPSTNHDVSKRPIPVRFAPQCPAP